MSLPGTSPSSDGTTPSAPEDAPSAGGTKRTSAILMLTLAAAAWGYSFAGGKAMMLAVAAQVPGRNPWFYSSLMISFRFALAALILLVATSRNLRKLRPSECRQGIGLGIFSGLGVLLQADALQYTSASVVAFLTQFVAVLVPIYCAFRDRFLPPVRTVLCVLMVMVGVAILGQFDWRTLQFGRGEFEALLATIFFTAQILWLDRPAFRGNNSSRVSMLMFASCALIVAPAWFMNTQSASDLAVLLRPSWPMEFVFLTLTLIPSLLAFSLMNHWQPHVAPTTAGIIYCSEPLFATAMALFLPELLGEMLGVTYPNERFTSNLLIGGSLITLANVFIALAPPTPAGD